MMRRGRGPMRFRFTCDDEEISQGYTQSQVNSFGDCLPTQLSNSALKNNVKDFTDLVLEMLLQIRYPHIAPLLLCLKKALRFQFNATILKVVMSYFGKTFRLLACSMEAVFESIPP